MISITTRRWLQLVVATVGLTAFLATLVTAAYIYNVRFDLSPGNRFTLSDHAHQVLAKVTQPIKILSFIRTEDPRNPYIKDLLWQVSREQPLISYDVVDVNRNPALAAQYGVSTYGSTVVESGTKRADFSNPTESLLMSSILRVMQEAKKVYSMTGHGECSIENTDRNVGCSLLREALSMEGYTIEPLSLLGGAEVPEDADILVIPGPRSDLLEPEARSLGRWLDNGGKMLALLDPFRAPRLVALLGQYGIEVGANIVLDAGNRLAGGEQFSTAVADVNRQHLISSTLKSPPMFSLAAVVTARTDEDKGRMAETLLKTGPRSWASYDPTILEGGAAEFVAGRDINGPLPVGVAVTEPAAAAKEQGVETRIVAFGDSDFAGNRFLDYLGNKDLLVNSVNWLAREDTLMATRPQRKVGGKNQLFVSQEDADGVFWSAVVVQPGLFLLAGFGLFLYRRFGP
ncbi:MAG TPA: GldG family protein [Candidatus Limnocylindrales bacterium]|nr:GldG family protein [Candidatus Limnocylindrales bacterium]